MVNDTFFFISYSSHSSEVLEEKNKCLVYLSNKCCVKRERRSILIWTCQILVSHASPATPLATPTLPHTKSESTHMWPPLSLLCGNISRPVWLGSTGTPCKGRAEPVVLLKRHQRASESTEESRFQKGLTHRPGPSSNQPSLDLILFYGQRGLF